MDVTKCAEVLWASASRYEAIKGKEPEFDAALAELAKLINQLDGAGFPDPRKPNAVERTTDTWKRCSAAAAAAVGAGNAAGDHAVIWTADDADGSKPAASLPLRWPFGETALRVQGPFHDTVSNKPVSLFLYDQINVAKALTDDGDAAPGLLPRTLLRPSFSPLSQKLRKAGPAAYLTFAAGLAMLIGSAVWIWCLTDDAKAAAQCFAKSSYGTLTIAPAPGAPPAPSTVVDCLARAQKGTRDDATEDLVWATDPLKPRGCDDNWKAFYTAYTSKEDDRKKLLPAEECKRKPSDAGDLVLSLTQPVLLAMAGIVLLVFAAGLAVNGLWFGAFVDVRYRISLAAFQQASWTVIILGSYAVIALFNAGTMSMAIRIKSWAGVKEIAAIFPTMQYELWAVLGLVLVGSPVVSAMILKRKDEKGDEISEQLEVRKPAVPISYDKLDQRDSPEDVSLSDLFTGESEANAGTVDISRLQHLVITLLLLATYFNLVLQLVRQIGGRELILAYVAGLPVFPAMPQIDSSFLVLLGASHAAYLGFKAMPKMEKK